MRERLLATPDIEAVALAGDAPLLGYSTDHVVADGDPPPADGHGAPTPYFVVDERYFTTLGIRVLQGRTFDSRDRQDRTEAVVINSTLAHQHWPGRDPLGRRLRIENGHRLVEVIGVVADGRYGDIAEDQQPFMYFALAQHYLPDVTVIVRTNGTRDTVIRALDGLPHVVFGGVGIMTLDDVLGLSLILPRTIVWTTIVFGILAFGLAAFGLYSTVFYAVSQRRMEIGIRTALGATPRHLFTLVLRESGWVALVGAVVGLGSGLSLLPLASSIFYGIGSTEPIVLVSVALASAAVALATTYMVVRPWTRLAVLDLLRR
jgi:ABC-type antimicrobial peptide transport system permease subunit